jgi:1-acyl-sn-glycerol-3-phosphate acyltransferase
MNKAGMNETGMNETGMSDARLSERSRPEDRILIRMLRGVNLLLARVYHRLKVLQPLRLPAEGPAIIVCNHISCIDPMLIQATCSNRLIHWMMAKEYMDLPVVGRVFKILQVIPVDRGARDSGAVRMVLRQLKQGRVVGIFPEGKISTTSELLEFQSGVAMLAIKAGAPVYPAYLDGTQRNKTMWQGFLQRSRSVIAFGPEVIFDRTDASKPRVDLATAAIKTAVQNLKSSVDACRNMQ